MLLMEAIRMIRFTLALKNNKIQPFPNIQRSFPITIRP